MKKYWLRIFLLIFILVGCNQTTIGDDNFESKDIVNSNATIEQNPTIENENDNNLEYEDLYTNQPISTEEIFDSNENTLPDLLVNIWASDDRFDCGSQSVFLVEAQTSEIIPLLSNPEINYRFPEWSPDGNWIAYIESQPIIGMDSVWIMDVNTKNRIKISEDYHNSYEGPSTNCHVNGGLLEPLNWSQDSRYITFKYRSSTKNSQYFLIDVKEKETLELIGGNGALDAGWDSSENTLVLTHDEWISIHKIESINQIKMWTVKYPYALYDKTSGEWLIFGYSFSNNILQVINSKIIGSFIGISNGHLGFLGTWQFDINEGQWAQISESTEWGGPMIGKKSTLVCAMDGRIIFLDNQNGEEFADYSNIYDRLETCNKQKIFQDNLNNDWVSIIITVNRNYGVWVTEMQDEITPYLYFNIADSLLLENVLLITDYSWKN